MGCASSVHTAATHQDPAAKAATSKDGMLAASTGPALERKVFLQGPVSEDIASCIRRAEMPSTGPQQAPTPAARGSLPGGEDAKFASTSTCQNTVTDGLNHISQQAVDYSTASANGAQESFAAGAVQDGQSERASEPSPTGRTILQSSRSLSRSFGVRSRSGDSESAKQLQDDLLALRSKSASAAADAAVAEFDAECVAVPDAPIDSSGAAASSNDSPTRPALTISRSLNRSFGLKARFVDEEGEAESDDILRERLGLAAGEHIVEVDDASAGSDGECEEVDGVEGSASSIMEAYKRAETKDIIKSALRSTDSRTSNGKGGRGISFSNNVRPDVSTPDNGNGSEAPRPARITS